MTATAQTTKALIAKATAAGKRPTASDRDSQRQRVYRSEAVLNSYAKRLTKAEAESLVRKITQSEYVRKHYGVSAPTLTYRQTSRAFATDWGHRINLPQWAMSDAVVIHEVAHTYHMTMGHNWLFCYTFLDLVRKFMGQDAHDALKASFKANKVKFTPPRAPKALTPAQKAAAADRMAKARAARGMVSTGEWVVIVKRSEWANWSYVRSVGNYRLTLTQYAHRAMVRKTDAAALKMLQTVKRSTWSDVEVLLVDRRSVSNLRDFDPSTLVKR